MEYMDRDTAQGMGEQDRICTRAIQIAEELCLRFEGCYLRPYLCPAGIATIGIGSTAYEDGTPVSLSDKPITRDRAITLLRIRLMRDFLPGVRRLCPGIDSEERFAALLDFSYNVGLGSLRASTLRRRINAGRWNDVPKELRKWVKGGGRVLSGLVKRREAESDLIING